MYAIDTVRNAYIVCMYACMRDRRCNGRSPLAIIVVVLFEPRSDLTAHPATGRVFAMTGAVDTVVDALQHPDGVTIAALHSSLDIY